MSRFVLPVAIAVTLLYPIVGLFTLFEVDSMSLIPSLEAAAYITIAGLAVVSGIVLTGSAIVFLRRCGVRRWVVAGAGLTTFAWGAVSSSIITLLGGLSPGPSHTIDIPDRGTFYIYPVDCPLMEDRCPSSPLLRRVGWRRVEVDRLLGRYERHRVEGSSLIVVCTAGELRVDLETNE